jgi:hypothetical protein
MVKNKVVIIVIFICKMFAMDGFGQSFQNGDLDGIVTIGSDLPYNWLNVPFTDNNCIATQDGWDSPDLTNLNGPYSSSGINGNPYSGLTFVSGMYGGNPTNFWQEGIMQTVSGFLIGQSYLIRFYQTVVRNINALDKSGSWGVYIDTTLATITIPSYNNEFPGTNSLPWEARDFIFTANATSHLIKFLPMDDDSNFVFSTTDTSGAIRMGIDSISLEVITGIKVMNHSAGIKLYPNPTEDVLHFEMQYNFSGTIKITDALGKVMYLHNTERSTSDFSIDISNFSSGLYFVSFSNEYGVFNNKFLKQ